MKQFISAIFFLMMMFSFSCKEFQEVKVTGVKSFRLIKIGTDGIEAEVILGIKNPNNMGFSIYPSEFDVIFSGVNLGKAKLHKRVHIDANCEKVYVFKLKTSFQKFNFMDITNLLGSGKMGIVEVKGNLRVGKLFVTKSYPVDVREKVNLSQ